MCGTKCGVLFVLLVAVISSQGVCDQHMVQDFQDALETIPTEPQWPSGKVMYYDMEQAADDFLQKHTSGPAAEFAAAQVSVPGSSRLALLILAKLAAVEGAAETALYEAIYEEPRLRRDAVTAVAYVGPSDARRIAETLYRQEGPYEVRKAAVQILAAFGDAQTLDLLKQTLADEKNRFVRSALQTAVPQIEHRLTQVVPRRQGEWSRQQIVCWSTLRQTTLPRKVQGENWLAAETLHKQGQVFSRDFLEYKLETQDLLGIAIVGYQKEAWAIEDLKPWGQRGDTLGGFARHALAEIGTPEALRALEECLTPDIPRRAYHHLVMIFTMRGDLTTAEFMERLSEDARFSDTQRLQFSRICKSIRNRLDAP